MKQTSFSFEMHNSYNPKEYIESSCNSVAYRTILEWEDRWGVFPYKNSLLLCGQKSSGKTFLAKQWAEMSGAIFIKKEHKLTENMLKYYPGFIIENFYDWHEHQMLHYFNAINENNKYLLITCDEIPKIKLADLKSRIYSLNTIYINPPDENLIRLLIFKLFSNYSVIISNDVLSFLVKNLPKDFSSILDMVKKINKIALENKRKITTNLLKKVL